MWVADPLQSVAAMFWRGSKGEEGGSEAQEVARTADVGVKEGGQTKEETGKLKKTALEFGPSSKEGAEMLTGLCDVSNSGFGACEWKVTKARDKKPTHLFRILF